MQESHFGDFRLDIAVAILVELRPDRSRYPTDALAPALSDADEGAVQKEICVVWRRFGVSARRLRDHMFEDFYWRASVIRPQSMLFADPRDFAGKIVIEDDALIGSGVHIYTANHELSDRDIPIAKQGHREARDVVLRVGSWIGANAIILPGVEIGAGAVVGAGSIVSRSIPEGCIAAGNPARVIRNRFNADD